MIGESLAFSLGATLCGARRGPETSQSNRQIPSSKLIEQSYPFASHCTREDDQGAPAGRGRPASNIQHFQSGTLQCKRPIYRPLHKYYDVQAAVYDNYSAVLAERGLALGYRVDGSLKLLIARVTTLQKEVYRFVN